MHAFTLQDVRRSLSARVRMYSWHQPTYQYVVLRNLQRLWDTSHRSMLDVGGGTGVMAQAVKELFALERVASVDVENRFLPSLDIETVVYDGVTLPFPDASFDCIAMFNVLHHVPVAARVALLRECRRVAGNGPIYIKDHISTGPLDDARLAALDFLGNVPFHGMLRASYLRQPDWARISGEAGYGSVAQLGGEYRHGVFAALFPNRLETSMKWCPA